MEVELSLVTISSAAFGDESIEEIILAMPEVQAEAETTRCAERSIDVVKEEIITPRRSRPLPPLPVTTLLEEDSDGELQEIRINPSPSGSFSADHVSSTLAPDAPPRNSLQVQRGAMTRDEARCNAPIRDFVSEEVVRRLNYELTGSSVLTDLRSQTRSCWRWMSPSALRSAWISYCRQESTSYRRMFQQQVQLIQKRVSPIHPHKTAAEMRNAVSAAISDFAHVCGCTPYSLQMSSRDPTGLLLYKSVRDLKLPARIDEVTSNTMFSMVDVDYYYNMNDILSQFRPVIMYTFVPTEAGGTVPNGSFTVIGDEVELLVDGGAKYRHQLWDYSHDIITCQTTSGDVLVFDVEQYLVEGDHQRRIVGLFPSVRIPWYASWLIDFPLCPLVRRKLSENNVSVIPSRKDGKDYLSLALDGYPSVTIERDLMIALRIRFENSKWKNMSDVERYLITEKIEKPAIKAALLFAVLTKGVLIPPSVPVTGVATLPVVADHVQTTKPLITEDGEDFARSILPPLAIGGAIVHSESYNNDQACVYGRVTSQENTAVPPARYVTYAREYAEFVVPVPGVGRPVDVEAVVDAQNKPQQRVRSELRRFWLRHYQFQVSAFQKREPNAKIAWSRNISSVTTDHTILLSQYTYAFKEQVMKMTHFYLPGLTPKQIAAVLVDFVRYLERCSESDFSKFDGTISEWLRINVEFACYLRWVAPEYKGELLKLFMEEVNSKARTATGVKYTPKWSRLSGGPSTTDGNTLINGFTDYCAGREEGLSPREAFITMGLACGDDGVTARSRSALEAVAGALGLSIKVIEHRRGEPVGLLGRVFIDPWTTDCSIQDPARTIGKAHLTMTKSTVDWKIAACNRARGYLITDGLTPLISNYYRAVLRILGEVVVSDEDAQVLSKDIPYYSSYGPENGWPQTQCDLLWVCVADALGVSVSALKDVCEALDKAQRFEDFPAPIFNLERKVEVTAVCAGELLKSNVEIPDALKPDRRSRNQTRKRNQILPSQVKGYLKEEKNGNKHPKPSKPTRQRKQGNKEEERTKETRQAGRSRRRQGSN